MERQVAHMKRLVDDLLDVSRITGKRMEMRMQPLRLADLVRPRGAVGPAGAGPAPPGPWRSTTHARLLWVSGDEVRLGQVLNNLLGNAIKFTGPGRHDHACALRRPTARRDHGDRHGFGMPPEVLEHVFDLFYQAPQGADRSRAGLGLGLAIVRSLVEMHGGSVQAESAGDGRGSAFTVRLPRPTPPRPHAARRGRGALAAGNGASCWWTTTRTRPTLAPRCWRSPATRCGWPTTPASALHHPDQFPPQVAVLDIGLPGMSGYELATRLRAIEMGQTAILWRSPATARRRTSPTRLEAGFQQHLVKPAPPTRCWTRSTGACRTSRIPDAHDPTPPSRLHRRRLHRRHRPRQQPGARRHAGGADHRRAARRRWSEVDAVVVALKSRTIPAAEAVAQSLAALRWLREQGCGQFYFKVCSTFDSTPQGNIGPVAEALMHGAGRRLHARHAGLPRQRAHRLQGHLFVGDVLLNESGMRNHPLTPMTDANLVRVLQAQSEGEVGLVDHAVVRAGSEAIRARIASCAPRACASAIVDAVANEDLLALGRAIADAPLVVAGSGVAIGLPRNHGLRALARGRGAAAPARGAQAIVSGSCSLATNSAGGASSSAAAAPP